MSIDKSNYIMCEWCGRMIPIEETQECEPEDILYEYGSQKGIHHEEGCGRTYCDRCILLHEHDW